MVGWLHTQPWEKSSRGMPKGFGNCPVLNKHKEAAAAAKPGGEDADDDKDDTCALPIELLGVCVSE